MSEQVTFHGKGNPIMEIAFRDCVTWAWKHPQIQQAFEKETGMKPSADPIGAMIYEATGYDKEIAEAFILWFIANVWGEGE